MNIIKIEKNNQINGDGLRCVIWCAGCSHHCPHCHNPEAWDPNVGKPVGEWVYKALKEQLDKDEISGVTFSGGEVTYPANRGCLLCRYAYCNQRNGSAGSVKLEKGASSGITKQL